MHLKHLLSDKFVEFSTEIALVHKEMKDETVAYQSRIKTLREKADSLKTDFETWEKEQEVSPKTPKVEVTEMSAFGGHPLKTDAKETKKS
jgi:hypothetical protein